MSNQFTIFGVPNCGTTSLYRWMKWKGFTVQYLDGECYSADHTCEFEFKYKPVLIIRPPLKHHKATEFTYGKCPIETPMAKVRRFPNALVIDMMKMEKVPGWKYINEHRHTKRSMRCS